MIRLRLVALACSICFVCVVGFPWAFSGEAAPATPGALGTPQAASGCDGAAPWWKGTSARAAALLDGANNMNALMEPAYAPSSFPYDVVLRDAAIAWHIQGELQAAGDAQRTSKPPAAAVAINGAFVAVYDAYAKAYWDLAISINGNPLAAGATRNLIADDIVAANLLAGQLSGSGDVRVFLTKCGVSPT